MSESPKCGVSRSDGLKCGMYVDEPDGPGTAEPYKFESGDEVFVCFECLEAIERGVPAKRRHPIHRNDDCPCESGLKYKKCCMKVRIPSYEERKEAERQLEVKARLAAEDVRRSSARIDEQAKKKIVTAAEVRAEQEHAKRMLQVEGHVRREAAMLAREELRRRGRKNGRRR